VGNFVTNALTDCAIAFNVDGINYARPTSAQGVFFNLDRLEVLKGLKVTLYGKNATGGAINVVTKQAELGEQSGYETLELDNYSAKKLTGAVNLPLTEDIAVRVAGQTARRDGFYSDERRDLDTHAIRASYVNYLTESVSLKINADYFQAGGNVPGATYKGLGLDDSIGLFDSRAEELIGSTFVYLSGDFLQPLPEDDYYDNNFGDRLIGVWIFALTRLDSVLRNAKSMSKCHWKLVLCPTVMARWTTSLVRFT
jgi:iron complex outermembrane receptor protein